MRQQALELDWALDGAVAVVRLNRPAVRNALGAGLVRQLGDALARLDADPGVRAAVLTGAAPGFCSGSDLKELAVLSNVDAVRHEAQAGRMVRGISDLGIPVLAAVEGFAVGGGFLLATGCDLVVSASNARWHLPEVSLGWVPPWGLHGLIERVGPAAARRLAWGERPLTAEALHRLGGVDEVVEPGGALGRATEIAERLAALPAHAVTSTKRALARPVAGAADLDELSTQLFGHDLGMSREQDL